MLSCRYADDQRHDSTQYNLTYDIIGSEEGLCIEMFVSMYGRPYMVSSCLGFSSFFA